MKKIVVLLVIVAFALNAAPLFAQSKKTAPAGEKSLFQMMYNSMNVKCEVKDKNKMKSSAGPSFFQEMSNSIKEGSAKARQTSLRGEKTK